MNSSKSKHQSPKRVRLELNPQTKHPNQFNQQPMTPFQDRLGAHGPQETVRGLGIIDESPLNPNMNAEILVNQALIEWAQNKQKAFEKANSKWELKLKAEITKVEKKMAAKRNILLAKLEKSWNEKKLKATDEAIGKWARARFFPQGDTLGLVGATSGEFERQIGTRSNTGTGLQMSSVQQRPSAYTPEKDLVPFHTEIAPMPGYTKSAIPQLPTPLQSVQTPQPKTTQSKPRNRTSGTPSYTVQVNPYNAVSNEDRNTVVIPASNAIPIEDPKAVSMDPPYTDENPIKPAPSIRSKHIWTQEEVQALMAMRSQNMTYSAIAKELSIRFNRQVQTASVCEKFMRLTRDGNYTEFMAPPGQ